MSVEIIFYIFLAVLAILCVSVFLIICIITAILDGISKIDIFYKKEKKQ